MPATRLDDSPVQIQPYDVVGESSVPPLCFVYHVGLAREEISVTGVGQSCKVFHMGPPLEHNEMKLDVHGTAKLTADEIKKIENFYNERSDEYETSCRRPLKQFHIHPAVLPVTSSDETIIYYRFSCAGFVLSSYREAEIDLLNDSGLPTVELPFLREAYPDRSRELQNTRKREHLGLRGNGPWPVLLCGYLLHAFNRDTNEIREIPYEPRPEDEIFPRLP